jgi:hypothetical protein
VAQVLHVCIGWRGIWRAGSQGILVTGEF